jgi:hypothetical protein
MIGFLSVLGQGTVAPGAHVEQTRHLTPPAIFSALNVLLAGAEKMVYRRGRSGRKSVFNDDVGD